MEMLKSRAMLAAVLCAGMFMFTGCTTRLGDFTVLSTKNVDVSGLKPGDRQTGEDCVNLLFSMIPMGEVNWKNAMDQALERGKGDVMVDAVLTVKAWAIPYIFGQSCLEFTGTIAQSASYKH